MILWVCIDRPAWGLFTGSSGGSGVPVGAVVGGVLGLFAVFVIILGLVLYKRRKHFSWFDIFTVKGRRGWSPLSLQYVQLSMFSTGSAMDA